MKSAAKSKVIYNMYTQATSISEPATFVLITHFMFW